MWCKKKKSHQSIYVCAGTKVTLLHMYTYTGVCMCCHTIAYACAVKMSHITYECAVKPLYMYVMAYYHICMWCDVKNVIPLHMLSKMSHTTYVISKMSHTTYVMSKTSHTTYVMSKMAQTTYVMSNMLHHIDHSQLYQVTSPVTCLTLSALRNAWCVMITFQRIPNITHCALLLFIFGQNILQKSDIPIATYTVILASLKAEYSYLFLKVIPSLGQLLWAWKSLY